MLCVSEAIHFCADLELLLTSTKNAKFKVVDGKYLPIEYDDKYLLTKVYYVVLVFGRYFLFCYTTPQ